MKSRRITSFESPLAHVHICLVWTSGESFQTGQHRASSAVIQSEGEAICIARNLDSMLSDKGGHKATQSLWVFKLHP